MIQPEESLDPSDWSLFRVSAHRALDDAIALLAGVRERRPWTPVPPRSRTALDEPAPREGAGLDQVLDLFREHVLPYPTGNIHPRFWGWVMGTGTADGVVADLLASAMNAHVA